MWYPTQVFIFFSLCLKDEIKVFFLFFTASTLDLFVERGGGDSAKNKKNFLVEDQTIRVGGHVFGHVEYK